MLGGNTSICRDRCAMLKHRLHRANTTPSTRTLNDRTLICKRLLSHIFYRVPRTRPSSMPRSKSLLESSAVPRTHRHLRRPESASQRWILHGFHALHGRLLSARKAELPASAMTSAAHALPVLSLTPPSRQGIFGILLRTPNCQPIPLSGGGMLIKGDSEMRTSQESSAARMQNATYSPQTFVWMRRRRQQDCSVS